MEKAKQVLGTVELVECIFEQLPISSLLQDMRVCRLWREIMIESPSLRRRLYLEVIEDKETTETSPPVPKLQRRFNSYLLDPKHRLGETWKLACMGSRILPKSFGYPKASWRKMQLVQPAETIVTLEVSYHHVFQRFDNGYDIVNPAGVTLEDYVAALDKLAVFDNKPRFVSLRGLINSS